ncbi:1-deoxy-D-xylulose-5-phosphate synthase [Trichinella pseudospiralis]
MGLSHTAQETAWLRTLKSELEKETSKLTLLCDNSGSISISTGQSSSFFDLTWSDTYYDAIPSQQEQRRVSFEQQQLPWQSRRLTRPTRNCRFCPLICFFNLCTSWLNPANFTCAQCKQKNPHILQELTNEELNDDKSSQFQRQIKLLFGGGSDAIAGQLFLCKLPVHLHGPCTLPGSAVDGMGRAG